MLQMLQPRLVVFSGICAAGRTTLSRELARLVPNAFPLTRDEVMYYCSLLIDGTDPTPNLPTFEKYVADDTVFPDFIRTIDTPFGEMRQVTHANHNDFWKRHARRQAFIGMARLAMRGLEIGKVPVIDGFMGNHISGGWLQRFLAHQWFAPWPKYHVHVIVSHEECFRRLKDRIAAEPDAAERAKSGYTDLAKFADLMEREQPSAPAGLEEMKHLLVDTTGRTIAECAAECFEYISR